ncbi:hypothetical protein [Haliangium sp.]|uniref:hypothetical protein n=1 Tax=Haliangium sp. TaxID=2663208 RepID=UPI003D0F2258
MSVTVPSLIEAVPGYLGLLPDDPGVVALVRFDERDAALAPRDALGALTAMRAAPARPAVVEGYTGPARRFDGAQGLVADDTAGRTLLPRTVSVLALVHWDAAATSGPDTIVARGLGGGPLEHRSWHLRIAKPGAGTGRLEWAWQDRAGVERVQPGGAFFVPADGFVLLAATREWAGDRFLLRYWAGETLLAAAESSDIEVSGGVGGHVTIGVREDGAGGRIEHFHGALDQLAVLSTPLTQEQVSWVWRRLARWQPGLYDSLRALTPPGRARSRDRDSLVQRDLRTRAGALGTIAAAVELRALAGLPDRAFGDRLRAWERAARQLAGPADPVEVRRNRVIAAFQRESGFSHDSLRQSLAPLLGIAEEDVDIFEGTNVTSGVDVEAWAFTGAGATPESASGGRVAVDTGAETVEMVVGASTAFSTLDGPCRYRAAALDGCVLDAELVTASAERVFVAVWSPGDVARGLEITVSDAAALVSAPAELAGIYPLPLRIRIRARDGQVFAALTGGAEVALGPCPSPIAWAGVSVVPTIPTRPSEDVTATWRLVVWNPQSRAPLHGYVLSETAADLAGARAQLSAQKPAHIFAAVITRPCLVCDDADNGTDQAPLCPSPTKGT